MFSSFLEEERRQERNSWYHDTKNNTRNDVSDHVGDDPLPLNIPLSEDDEEAVVKNELSENDACYNQVSFVYDLKQDPEVEVENNGQVLPEGTYSYYDYGMNQNYFEQVHYESLEEYHAYNYFDYNPNQVFSNTYYYNHEEHFYTTIPYDFSLSYQIPILQQNPQSIDEKPPISILKQEFPNQEVFEEQGNAEQVSGSLPSVLLYPPAQLMISHEISQTTSQQLLQQDNTKSRPVFVKQEPDDENLFLNVSEDNSGYNTHFFEETNVVHYPDLVPYSNSNQSVNSDDLIVKKGFQGLKRRRNFTKKMKNTKRRDIAKKEEELTNVSLPNGFEQILERASATNSDSSSRRWKQKFRKDEELEKSRKRDIRRCETKVMLQSADGKLFNKFFEEEDIREFARKFKILRTNYGFSQSDVGEALGTRYGLEFSQTTISRFESLVLSHTNMCKLRPPIEEWLNDVKNSLECGMTVEDIKKAYRNGDFWVREKSNEETASLVLPVRKRKRRTSLEACQKIALEAFFAKNQKPDYNQMMDISGSLDLCFEVVRVWFSNRRQKLRKTEMKKKDSCKSYKTNDCSEIYMDEYGS